MVEEMHCETQGGNDKRPRFEGSFSGSRSISLLRGSSSYGRYSPHLSFQPQSQPSRLLQITYVGQSSSSNHLG